MVDVCARQALHIVALLQLLPVTQHKTTFCCCHSLHTFTQNIAVACRMHTYWHTGQRADSPPSSATRSAVSVSTGRALTTFWDAGGASGCVTASACDISSACCAIMSSSAQLPTSSLIYHIECACICIMITGKHKMRTHLPAWLAWPRQAQQRCLLHSVGLGRTHAGHAA